MTATGTDVVVIGGGIVGASAAAFLAEAGATVTLVERDGLASGASGANSGIVQHPFDPILAALYRETVGLYRELTAADVGFRLGAEPAGLIYVSADEAAVRAVDRSLAEAFPELERVVAGGTELQAIEPAIAPGVWGCLVGIGYPVAPAASTYAYATIAERRGVRVRAGRTRRPRPARRGRRRGRGGWRVDTGGCGPGGGGAGIAGRRRPDRGVAADPGALGRRRRDRAADRPRPHPGGGRDRRGDRHRVDRDGRRRTRRPSQPGAARRRRRDRVDVPGARAGAGGLDRADPHPGERVRSRRHRRADPGDACVRTAAEHGRPPADRSHRRRCPACSSAPDTAPGGSRPGRPRPGWWSTRCSAGLRSSRPSSIRAGSGRSVPLHDDDLEPPRAVDALDALELDVARGGRTADPRLRPHGSRRASASGTVPTTCSACTMQTWRSGSRLSARRP